VQDVGYFCEFGDASVDTLGIDSATSHYVPGRVLAYVAQQMLRDQADDLRILSEDERRVLQR
jgi:hypothetical protein